MNTPQKPKIYHIAHVDRLPSIVNIGSLLSDAEILRRNLAGTAIGMNSIKQRRLSELRLNCWPDLYVGDCVPFYFCPRSIMLYLIHRQNHPELAYNGGQVPIVHLEADLNTVVAWAEANGNRRWAFTLSNAGSYYFEDRNDLANLNEIIWPAVSSNQWTNCKEGKQAEFLMHHSFPFELVERVGVHSAPMHQLVSNALLASAHQPTVEILPSWYY